MALLLACAVAASDPWVLVRDEQNISMSGDLSNLATARKYLKKFGGPYLWFRHGGKQYVVRDGKLLGQVDAAMQDEPETAEAEAEIDRRQEFLERHQARLEKSQEELEAYDGDDPAMERARRELERAQEELNRAQEKLERAQEKLAHESEKLGEQMEKKMHELIARALQQGAAVELQ